jgi:hypothetical protein
VTDQRRELRELWDAVRVLTFEQQRSADREAHEREKFMLRVENQLLKAGRQLPPPQKTMTNSEAALRHHVE